MSGEHYYRQVAESSPDAILIHQELRVVYANPAMAQLLAASSREDLVGRDLLSIVPEAHHAELRTRVAALYAGAAQPRAEQVFRRLDGKPMHVEVTAAPLELGGKPAAHVTVRDITERRRVETEARATNERLEIVSRATNDGIWDWDLRTDRVWVSDTFGYMLGCPSGELDHVALWSERLHPDDRTRVLGQIGTVLEGGGRLWSAEYRLRHRDGAYVYVWDRGFVMRDDKGAALRMIGAMTDISERKRGEQALRDANERLHALSARLLEVQEQERAGIARELHDELGQALTALKLQTAALARRMTGPAAEALRQSLAIVDRALGQTRTLALDLRPPQLDQLGLTAALRDHVERIAGMARLEWSFVGPSRELEPAKSVATAAFRVAQEALTNAVRHATGARKVVVELRPHGGELLVAVSDDGCGFDLDSARARAIKGRSMGLLGMEERVTLAGGRLQIITRPGQGTRVQATFPLEARDISGHLP
jgi:two-component system, NarL family, sensor histidine kinase UhpB